MPTLTMAKALNEGLRTAMERDPIAPVENVRTLREGLAEHFKNDRYLKCESMGALVRENLEMLRINIQHGQGALKADSLLPTPPGDKGAILKTENRASKI